MPAIDLGRWPEYVMRPLNLYTSLHGATRDLRALAHHQL